MATTDGSRLCEWSGQLFLVSPLSFRNRMDDDDAYQEEEDVDVNRRTRDEFTMLRRLRILPRKKSNERPTLRRVWPSLLMEIHYVFIMNHKEQIDLTPQHKPTNKSFDLERRGGEGNVSVQSCRLLFSSLWCQTWRAGSSVSCRSVGRFLFSLSISFSVLVFQLGLDECDESVVDDPQWNLADVVRSLFSWKFPKCRAYFSRRGPWATKMVLRRHLGVVLRKLNLIRRTITRYIQYHNIESIETAWKKNETCTSDNDNNLGDDLYRNGSMTTTPTGI